MSQNTEIKKEAKFSLIELLMIIMLVGIVITFIVPMRTAKRHKEMTKEAVYNIQVIRQANIKFRDDENLGDGDFAFDISQLNLNLDAQFFEYSVNDTIIMATTTEKYGRPGGEIHYYLPNGPWQLKDDEITKQLVDNSWLP